MSTRDSIRMLDIIRLTVVALLHLRSDLDPLNGFIAILRSAIGRTKNAACFNANDLDSVQ